MTTRLTQIPPGPAEKYDRSQNLLSWMMCNFKQFGNIYKASVYGSETTIRRWHRILVFFPANRHTTCSLHSRSGRWEIWSLRLWRTGGENGVSTDILSMLMEARDRESGQGMPERQLVNEVMTLIVVGHETTASTLDWIW